LAYFHARQFCNIPEILKVDGVSRVAVAAIQAVPLIHDGLTCVQHIQPLVIAAAAMRSRAQFSMVSAACCQKKDVPLLLLLLSPTQHQLPNGPNTPDLGTLTCRLLAAPCCCCAAVRGDLIRILNKLAKRRSKFDHILIETTGE
jgi:hypothetical protein